MSYFGGGIPDYKKVQVPKTSLNRLFFKLEKVRILMSLTLIEIIRNALIIEIRVGLVLQHDMYGIY